MAYLKIAYLSGVASAETKLGIKQATLMGSAPEAPQTREAPVSAPGTNVRPVAPPAPAPMPGALDGSGEPKLASAKDTALKYVGAGTGGGLWGGGVGALAAGEGNRLEGAGVGAGIGALGGVGGMNFARRTNNRALKEIAQDLGTMEAAGINKVVDIPAGMKFKSVNPNYEMPQASILEGTEALMAQMSDPAYQAAAEVGGTSIGQLAGMGGALSGGLALRAGEKNN